MFFSHNYFKKVQKRVASRQKIWYYKFRDSNYGGVTQLVECHTGSVEVVSSSLIWVVYGVLAQLGEHLPYKQRVIGSSPIGPIFSI